VRTLSGAAAPARGAAHEQAKRRSGAGPCLPRHRSSQGWKCTAHPTAEWTPRQLIQAFPEQTAPRFLMRDRGKIYGERLRQAVEILGIEEVVMAARSPWQNPYAERLIGSFAGTAWIKSWCWTRYTSDGSWGGTSSMTWRTRPPTRPGRGRSFRQEQLHTAGIEVDLNRFLRKCSPELRQTVESIKDRLSCQRIFRSSSSSSPPPLRP